MPSGIYTRTEEHKQKLSDAKKGENHPLYGKHLSEEHKRKISETEKGKHISLQTRKKMSEIAKGRIGEKNPAWKGGINKDKNHIRELGKQVSHKYRALKKEIRGFYTLGEWELLKKQYGYKCPLCKKKAPEIKLTIDHIIPLSKGGSNYIKNIQPLCLICNFKKHTKIFRITPNGELMLF